MDLKLKHILIIITSFLLVACAMENRSAKSADETYEAATEEVLDIDMVEDFKFTLTVNTELINQKLQDFYDLIALQNEHPEFNDEVAKQLKNYTNDSINNYNTNDFAIIKNIKQFGKTITVNDSVQKRRLTYDKIIGSTKITDTIYVIITNKFIRIDNETLISNKIQFSKH